MMQHKESILPQPAKPAAFCCTLNFQSLTLHNPSQKKFWLGLYYPRETRPSSSEKQPGLSQSFFNMSDCCLDGRFPSQNFEKVYSSHPSSKDRDVLSMLYFCGILRIFCRDIRPLISLHLSYNASVLYSMTSGLQTILPHSLQQASLPRYSYCILLIFPTIGTLSLMMQSTFLKHASQYIELFSILNASWFAFVSLHLICKKIKNIAFVWKNLAY